MEVLILIKEDFDVTYRKRSFNYIIPKNVGNMYK
jgi:hypothetical protein